MIGAKNFVAIGNGLQFTVGRNAKSVKWIQIILDIGQDSYNFRALKANAQVAFEIDDVYVDMLHDLIETSTGMYTKL